MMLPTPHPFLVAVALISLNASSAAEVLSMKPRPEALLRAPGPVSAPLLEPATKALSTNAPAFRMSNVIQTIHGGVKIPMLVVTTGANKFSFAPPPGWRSQSDSARKQVKLGRSDHGALILIQIVEDASPMPDMTHEKLRGMLAGRFPSDRVVDELSISALGSSGPALDLEWAPSNLPRQTARFGVIPFPGGYLECSLTGPAQQANQDQHDFNRLLLSFRHASGDGRLQLQPVNPE